MPRPLSLLPALVAVAVTAPPSLPVPAAGATTPVATGLSTAAAQEEDEDPLQVSIARLTPSEIPQRGDVRMTGAVTNVSDERWRAINVYALLGREPMTTSEELAQARLVPPAATVGERILTPGTFDSIGTCSVS